MIDHGSGSHDVGNCGYCRDKMSKPMKEEVEKVMSKIFEKYVERLERDNWELFKGLKWCLIQLEHIDHDCHAGPDSGCGWCAEFDEYRQLIANIERESEGNGERSRD